MRKGDIVLVPFPFTDLTATKNRPALVLVSDEDDVTLAFITTRRYWKKEWDLFLEPTTENGLKKKSIVRLSKITTLEKKRVLGQLGSISSTKMELLNSNLKLLLDI